jgi:predicted amidophosphoribosyltransferase
MAFIGDLIRDHGWHVIAELAALTLFTVFTVIYLTALFRGRVHAAPCPACGRVASRAHARCPRCGAALTVGRQP